MGRENAAAITGFVDGQAPKKVPPVDLKVPYMSFNLWVGHVVLTKVFRKFLIWALPMTLYFKICGQRKHISQGFVKHVNLFMDDARSSIHSF